LSALVRRVHQTRGSPIARPTTTVILGDRPRTDPPRSHPVGKVPPMIAETSVFGPLQMEWSRKQVVWKVVVYRVGTG